MELLGLADLVLLCPSDMFRWLERLIKNNLILLKDHGCTSYILIVCL